MQLLIGCGSSREKRLVWQGRSDWDGLVTLDVEKSHNPDVVWDLNNLPLPFDDNSAEEIHGFEVLEHCGRQGDAKFFFEQFADFWRILKPGGVFLGSVPLPTSVWAFGDPSHTRVIPFESLSFLHQPFYAQVGKSPASDFRSIYRADFDIVYRDTTEHCLFFGLQAVKPARLT